MWSYERPASEAVRQEFRQKFRRAGSLSVGLPFVPEEDLPKIKVPYT